MTRKEINARNQARNKAAWDKWKTGRPQEMVELQKQETRLENKYQRNKSESERKKIKAEYRQVMERLQEIYGGME